MKPICKKFIVENKSEIQELLNLVMKGKTLEECEKYANLLIYAASYYKTTNIILERNDIKKELIYNEFLTHTEGAKDYMLSYWVI